MAGRRRFSETLPPCNAPVRVRPEAPARVFDEERESKRLRSANFQDDGIEPVATEKPGPRRDQLRVTHKPVTQLIGAVRPVNDPTKVRLCTHFLKGDCMWGDTCRFSHNPEALRGGLPLTECMKFDNLDAAHVSRTIEVPKAQLRVFMAESMTRLLKEASGVSEVTWGAAEVNVSGMATQVEKAEQLLKRATNHCKWGISEDKVHRLLASQPCTFARLRLSPMAAGSKQAAFHLTAAKPYVNIGSDPASDLVLKGALVSRAHVMLEFDPGKGTLYAIDKSTNGTFLNGVQLPPKSIRKVAVFHGDELLFPEPNKAIEAMEFGYMVNLELG